MLREIYYKRIRIPQNKIRICYFFKYQIWPLFLLVLNLGHSPLYRHFCKCLYIEMLKFYLFINYFIHFTHM